MKTTIVSVVSTLAACLTLSHAQELRTITQASGSVAIPANAIVQIVGVACGAYNHNGTNAVLTPCSMSQTFGDGTVLKTDLYQGFTGTGIINNNNLVGNVFTGVTSISVKNGFFYPNAVPIALTVKIMADASQVVSPPMILPVDDELFSISLETSTDMQDWVPAFPGDYLGSSNHRFFRVKAVRKPASAPAAPAPAAK